LADDPSRATDAAAFDAVGATARTQPVEAARRHRCGVVVVAMILFFVAWYRRRDHSGS
jgi:hypothetical protein